ncbi:MAG: hypothetical protein KZQ83_03815 [gamma proteobacterium symbiont of Taylorina sp.]|nr:hypothetical protein [gamma proteobacterium symbiont of Taylorina sp.]
MLHISHTNHAENSDPVIKIIVENCFDNEKEIEQFLELLHPYGTKIDEYAYTEKELKKLIYQVTFIETKTLPSLVIKALFLVKEKLLIETTEKSLWLYLANLGLKNKFNHLYLQPVVQSNYSIKAIALGGSAGSIDKIITIIKKLPYVDISIFITVHLLPDKKNYLAEILQKISDYKVCQVREKMPVMANSVYIAAPDTHLLIKNHHVYPSKGSPVNFSRPSINVMFESLSHCYKQELLAILLCGYGEDGITSLKSLKNNRCRVLIENPNECEAQEMPLNAIISKNFDKILNLTEIYEHIQSIFQVEIDSRDALNHFLNNIYLIYGYDFRNYDKKSLYRRIRLMMQDHQIEQFQQFEQLVYADEAVFAIMASKFSINVTTFFRNPTTYQAIRTQLIPELATYPSIKIWSVGCSRGDEAYSMAILLDEAGLLHKSQIYATDVNKEILNQAENSLYTHEDYQCFKKNYQLSGGLAEFEQWFVIKDDYVEVKKRIKDKILFFNHNLASDTSMNEFNLVLCRNVLIYFDRVLQKRVFMTIDDSLIRNGFLVLGKSETLSQNLSYQKVADQKFKIYKK